MHLLLGVVIIIVGIYFFFEAIINKEKKLNVDALINDLSFGFILFILGLALCLGLFKD